MSTKSKIIALGTALVIGTGAFASAAGAAPLGGMSAANFETGSAVETVGWKKKKWGHHHDHNYGEAAIIGLGAFALGAAIASSSAYAAQPVCYDQKVKFWSNQYQAYVIKTQRVCE